MGTAWKKATDIRRGDHVAEADGSFFRVRDTKPVSDGEIALFLENVSRYMTGPAEIRVSEASSVRVVVFEVPQ